MNSRNSFLYNFLPAVLLVYCAFSIFLLMRFEFENNEPFIFTLVYFGPVVFLGLLLLIKREYAGYKNAIYAVGRILQLFMIGAFISLSTTPYVLYINANIGKQSDICLKGIIKEKGINRESGWYKSYSVVVFNQVISRETKLVVSRKKYDRFKVGDHFDDCMLEGVFGLIYKNR